MGAQEGAASSQLTPDFGIKVRPKVHI